MTRLEPMGMSDEPDSLMPGWFDKAGWASIPELVRHFERSAAGTARNHELTQQVLFERFPQLAEVEVADQQIPGPHGPVPGRLYRNSSICSERALVWVHGGAFIFYDLDGPEAHWVALSLAARGVAVLSLDYRKALHGVHFPVPSDDVLAGWLWAAEDPGRLGVALKDLHFGGASAGANLVAGVSKRLRDGSGPAPASVILAYPFIGAEQATDLAEETVPDRFPRWWLWQMAVNYVGQADVLLDPYAFPLNGDLRGLPPTYILNSDLDSIRESGETYGRRLAWEGVPVSVEHEPGTLHGQFDRPLTIGAQRSVERIAQWILTERHLATPARSVPQA